MSTVGYQPVSFTLQFVHGQAGSKSNNALHSAMQLAGHFEPMALTTKAFLRPFFVWRLTPIWAPSSWNLGRTSSFPGSIPTLGKPSLYLNLEVIITDMTKLSRHIIT